MGTIMSAESEIDRVQFRQIDKGRPAKATRVMKIDERTAIVELESGGLTIIGPEAYLNRPVAMLGFGGEGPGRVILRGLVKMGVISKEAANRHVERVNARSEDKRREWAERDLRRACETLGIDMPELPAADDEAA